MSAALTTDSRSRARPACPGVDSDPDETLRRARSAAQALTRRRVVRRGQAAVIAFAALALLTGAALAASRFDVLPFFDQSNRSSASYSVDNSRTYSGPAPRVLLCPDARHGSFNCSVGTRKAGESPRLLDGDARGAHAETDPGGTPRLAGGGREEGTGRGGRAADRFRRDLAAVSDDFLTVWNLASGGGHLRRHTGVGGAWLRTRCAAWLRVRPARGGACGVRLPGGGRRVPLPRPCLEPRCACGNTALQASVEL